MTILDDMAERLALLESLFRSLDAGLAGLEGMGSELGTDGSGREVGNA